MAGELALDKFSPSNEFAFAQNVNYTILFTPSHSSTNTTRITIKMPENLIFEEGQPCFADVLISDCEVIADKNQIVLTNSFNETFDGGQQLKVVLGHATNPNGARTAGAWGIFTENMYNGIYYMVDSATSPVSFFANAGYIMSNIRTVQASTYSPSRMDLNLTTEHGVPENGIVRINLPQEMLFANYTDDISPNGYFLD